VQSAFGLQARRGPSLALAVTDWCPRAEVSGGWATGGPFRGREPRRACASSWPRPTVRRRPAEAGAHAASPPCDGVAGERLHSAHGWRAAWCRRAAVPAGSALRVGIASVCAACARSLTRLLAPRTPHPRAWAPSCVLKKSVQHASPATRTTRSRGAPIGDHHPPQAPAGSIAPDEGVPNGFLRSLKGRGAPKSAGQGQANHGQRRSPATGSPLGLERGGCHFWLRTRAQVAGCGR
jgi:hypothetical protein